VDPRYIVGMYCAGSKKKQITEDLRMIAKYIKTPYKEMENGTAHSVKKCRRADGRFVGDRKSCVWPRRDGTEVQAAFC
ncbi:MAG TPA: hypothetical protein VGV14_10575, partial [Rhodanobacter sp.]|nr:hypothetical protein [Rhodanobacter sp.]